MPLISSQPCSQSHFRLYPISTTPKLLVSKHVIFFILKLSSLLLYCFSSSCFLCLCFPLYFFQNHTVYISFGEGSGTPLQYSCLENPMDGGAWWAAVHRVARSRTRLSDFTLFFHFLALEKEMATHSRVIAWRIPGTGEPGGLPSMGSHRVRHG